MAAYQAKLQGIEIAYLLNMVTADKQHSCSHGITAQWIRQQAEALGIPLLQFPTTGDNYQSIFTNALKELKYNGVTAGVFGDIDFEPHREWIEKICRHQGLHRFYLSGVGIRSKLSADFSKLGFKAKVIATQADLLGEEWLGRTIDNQFLQDLADVKKSITPCGEAGEFHTLVIDGPIFKKRLEIRDAAPQKRGEHWFWDIKKMELVEKVHGGYS